jgi:hypothetical protein
MTQLDTIRYEVQSLSRLTPGQFTMKQHNTGNYKLLNLHYNKITFCLLSIPPMAYLNNMPEGPLFSFILRRHG